MPFSCWAISSSVMCRFGSGVLFGVKNGGDLVMLELDLCVQEALSIVVHICFDVHHCFSLMQMFLRIIDDGHGGKRNARRWGCN